MELPKDILDRAERVYEYHRTSKGDGSPTVAPPDPAQRPDPWRVFAQAPKVPLLATLLDLPLGVLTVQQHGLEGLPVSQLNPPQDLKTLSTWLYMAYGMVKLAKPGQPQWTRTCPSLEATYPCEIYVAAFAIEGLEPGFYHFSAREFALRRLRGGPETLAMITRGRPDLEFVKQSPGALLISTVFSRSAWRFGPRGYRSALIDAGHLVGNAVAVATALGVQTMTRLRMPDAASRELIGLDPQTQPGHEEAVQAMIVWATQAASPLPLPTGELPKLDLPPIDRGAGGAAMPGHASILATHQDCVAPGFVIRDVRPPMTELTPLPPDMPVAQFPDLEDPPHGRPVREVELQGAQAVELGQRTVARDLFLEMNRLAHRGGSFFPVFPGGPYVGLVRPFWIIHDVTGIDSGVWYYHPPADSWTMLNHGDFRMEAMYLGGESQLCHDAAAVCVMFANLRLLLLKGGPDLYRLAHLEAGIIAQRLYMSATSLDLACCSIGSFYDEEIRRFLATDKTGWEPIHMVALGVPVDVVELSEKDQLGVAWRD
jgi:SagB-type dehydrogenase family enzyme